MNPNPTVLNFKAEPLTEPELRSQAQSIFADRPMIGLSTRYTFVPTNEIVTGLREKGWVPVTVEQQHVRSELRRGFQKHLLRFRRAEQMQALGEWNAELVLTNSHDAASAYILMVGIFRRICSNGLVVSDDTFESIRFRHFGLTTERVVQASYRVLEGIPKVTGLIGKFRNCWLTETQRTSFVDQAILMRYENLDESPIRSQTLLTPRRMEDQFNDLWTVYNRVQENLVRGGLSDGNRTRNGRLRTMRSLRGIDSKLALNKRLWNLAESFAR